MKSNIPEPLLKFADEAAFQQLSRSVDRVWQYIGHDILEVDEFISNMDALETCMDASRLLTDAEDGASDALVQRIYAAGKRRELLRWLSSEHRFV